MQGPELDCSWVSSSEEGRPQHEEKAAKESDVLCLQNDAARQICSAKTCKFFLLFTISVVDPDSESGACLTGWIRIRNG